MDIKQDNPRGRSPHHGLNQQREQSTDSYESSSSIDYTERMQAQSDNMKWAEQVEVELQQNQDDHIGLQMSNVESPFPTHDIGMNNIIASPPALEPSVIPYQANQPVDPLLWNRNFLAISLFGTDEFLSGNAKNIACSLQRMVNFIKQRPISDKTEKDIPQIDQFGYAAWQFILAIYEAG